MFCYFIATALFLALLATVFASIRRAVVVWFRLIKIGQAPVQKLKLDWQRERFVRPINLATKELPPGITKLATVISVRMGKVLEDAIAIPEAM